MFELHIGIFITFGIITTMKIVFVEHEKDTKIFTILNEQYLPKHICLGGRKQKKC